MSLSRADGAGEAVLFGAPANLFVPSFFAAVVGSFLEHIVLFAHQSSLLYLYGSLLHANKYRYRQQSYLYWSKLHVSDTLISELDTEILMILTVIVNRQKHELMKEQEADEGKKKHQRQIGYTSRIVIDCKKKQRKTDVTIEKGDRCVFLQGVVEQ
jgi:hypothetical protein